MRLSAEYVYIYIYTDENVVLITYIYHCVLESAERSCILK